MGCRSKNCSIRTTYYGRDIFKIILNLRSDVYRIEADIVLNTSAATGYELMTFKREILILPLESQTKENESFVIKLVQGGKIIKIFIKKLKLARARCCQKKEDDR